MPKDRVLTATWIVVVAAILYFAVHVVVALADDGPTGATGPVVQVESKPSCSRISADRFNEVQRKRRALGERVRLTRKPVCAAKFRRAKKRLREARADCLGKARRTTASYYPLEGRGACGPLRADGFATLASGDVTLPCGAVIYVNAGGRVARIVKVDIGGGGGGLGGTSRGIDLVKPVADQLGITGLGIVEWSPVNCWA